MVGRQADVGALVLQDMEQPMRQLDVAVARALGLAQRLDEGLVADPVELARYRLEADVGHRRPLVCCGALRRLALPWACRSAGWKRASQRMVWSVAAQFGAIQLVQPSCPKLPEA